jgi:DNA recombination protein RmuC
MEDPLYMIIASLFGGLIVGGALGFLLASRRASAAIRDAAKFEAEASAARSRVADAESRIKQFEEKDAHQQERLIEAEQARTKAETELAELKEDAEKAGLRAAELEGEIRRLSEQAVELKTSNADLNAKYNEAVKAIDEQKRFIVEANEKLREAFESLSSEALRRNNSSFLEMAKQTLESQTKESAAELEKRKQAIEHLVKPLGDSLSQFDKKLGEIELKREGAYVEMRTLLDAIKSTTNELGEGTKQLVGALKTSHVRGKYGEISLRRVVEVAGLSPYCDFQEQVSLSTEDGKLRPDMVISLPGGRQLILDSKVPLAAYMRAFETENDDERVRELGEHAKAVRKHLGDLSKKSYWEQLPDTVDFVVMYMQIESSFGAALMADPKLIEDGINNQIVLATPSTLITMLRTVGFLWQQERMAESIYEMRDAGIELYKRTTTLLEHFSNVGAGLNRAVNSYNQAVGSLESRFITQLETIKKISGTLAKESIPALRPIETAIRPVTKSLTEGDDTVIEFGASE